MGKSTSESKTNGNSAYWVPIDQAWKKVGVDAVKDQLENPCPLGVMIINCRMLLFNTILEDAMVEHNAVHDFGRWEVELKEHIERLLPLVPDVPLLKARKVALFVAGTSCAFYDKFMDNKEIRDAVCAAYDSEGGLNTMTTPSLKAALHRLEIDKKIDSSIYKPYED